MASIRVSCFLLVLFILQVHAKGFNANFHTQAMDIVPQPAYNEGLEASTSTTSLSKNIHDLIGIRKMLKEVDPPGDEKKSLEIESELSSGTRNYEKKLKTASLTADYSDPGHHPPRHN